MARRGRTALRASTLRCGAGRGVVKQTGSRQGPCGAGRTDRGALRWPPPAGLEPPRRAASRGHGTPSVTRTIIVRMVAATAAHPRRAGTARPCKGGPRQGWAVASVRWFEWPSSWHDRSPLPLSSGDRALLPSYSDLRLCVRTAPGLGSSRALVPLPRRRCAPLQIRHVTKAGGGGAGGQGCLPLATARRLWAAGRGPASCHRAGALRWARDPAIAWGLWGQAGPRAAGAAFEQTELIKSDLQIRCENCMTYLAVACAQQSS